MQEQAQSWRYRAATAGWAIVACLLSACDRPVPDHFPMPEIHHLYRHEDAPQESGKPERAPRNGAAAKPAVQEPAVLDLSVKVPEPHEVPALDAESSLRLHDLFAVPEASPSTSVSVAPVLKDVVTADGKTRTVIQGATISVDKPL